MHYDIIIIGSGPGGYVAAIRAAQLGRHVAVVEKAELGGICLNWGCIPTKALLRSAELWERSHNLAEYGIEAQGYQLNFAQAVKRSREVASRLSKGVEFLFKKHHIELIAGTARFESDKGLSVIKPDGSAQVLFADSIIIATGARTRLIPGVVPDGKQIITSREALVLATVPKSLIVIGAGAIGVEFAYMYRVFGAEVTLVEMLPQILPQEDPEIARELTRALRKTGVNIFTGAMVKGLQTEAGTVRGVLEVNGKIQPLEAECVLVATGVQPNSEELGLEAIGVATERGWIKVNQHYQTSVPHIFAIGDVIGNPCLAHVASAEGLHAIEFIAGKNPLPIDYNAIPGCTYCQPQVASVGLTEQKALAQGIEVKIGRAFFRANGKALALGEFEGMVKVIFDAKTERLVGAHVIGPEATELIPELGLAVANHLRFGELRNVVHAHPTLAETVMEALHDAFGEAIHK